MFAGLVQWRRRYSAKAMTSGSAAYPNRFRRLDLMTVTLPWQPAPVAPECNRYDFGMPSAVALMADGAAERVERGGYAGVATGRSTSSNGVAL
jgi:hypothetical protein